MIPAPPLLPPPANVTVTNPPPPIIALTSPANDAAFTAPATISLAANVTANGHTITRVQFYNDTNLLGEDTTAPYRFTWSSVAAGNYTLSAQAVYDSGSTVASIAATVTVTNLLPPTIALTSPANDAAFTAPASISLAADVTANGHSITRVQFYEGATLLGEDTTAPYTFTWSGVTAGKYSLTAQAMYDSGTTVASTAASVTVTNQLPPTIALTSPANNAAFTEPATISLAADVTANGHAITKVQFYNDANLLGEVTNAPYTFTWDSVPAGNYNLSAQVVYDSGTTVTSTPANVTVTSLPPPTIALTSPANNAALTAPATIDLAASVTANGHSITKVQFYNGANLLGEDTTAPYAFTWSSVTAGNYTLSAQVVYDSGTTVASTAASVTVTNQLPPAIALTSPADNAAFTAPATISLAANVTANGHPITKVQFYNGATLLGEDSTAPYAFTWSSVTAGNYSLTAQAVYDSGTTVASTAANVTVTNQLPPVIALTSPADNAAFTAPASISLAANVTANGHSITKVQFYNGATLLSEDATAPYTFTWSSVTAGNYNLTAQAVYDSGTVLSSTVANVTVTNLPPPTIALTSPANNSAFTEPAIISLAADVTANGHTITKVQFYNGPTLLGEGTNAPYAFTWDSVLAGTYSLTARLVYDADATLDSTPAVNVLVAAPKPLDPPVIALTSPANKSASAAPADLSLTASVTPNGHSISKVRFYSGNTLLGENTNPPYALRWTSVAPGNYTLSAQAVYDSGSTVSSPTAIVAVTKAVPPAITLTSPADNSAFTAPTTISLAADVIANGHAITKVQFYNGTTLLSENTSAPYAFTWSDVPAGTYSLTAQVDYDTGSKIVSAPADVTITNLPPPAIALTAPADKSAFAEPATISLAASITANGHSITKVQFYNGSILLGEDTTAPYEFTWNSVAAGNYSLTAQVVYDSGSTIASATAIVTVTKQVPPAIVLTSPANNTAFTAPAAISLAADVAANDHAITKVQFYNGASLLGETTTAPYVFTWSGVAAGNYSLTAQVIYDSGSIVGSTAANVTVTNLPPPTIALTSPADNSAFTAPAAISLAADVNANGHAITKVQFYNGASLLGETTSAPYVFTWSGVAAGHYSLTAQVIYDSGSTVASTAANVTITNLPPPAIALTSPANNSAFSAPAAISLAADVTANGHTITKVQFYNGASLLGETTTAPYAFTWSSVIAGNYSLSALAVYDSGRTVGSTAASVTVTNLLPPTIALTSPANNATFTEPATISLTANATANGHAIAKVQFYNGATLLGEDSTAPYAFTWSSVPAGSYSLKARLVYDAGATLDSTPAVNVLVAAPKPENAPPTISTIADQITPQDTPTPPISFTVGDAETDASNLTVYASSADPALVPTDNIVLAGSDTNRTVTLTPAYGATGTVAITVFVSDGSLTASATFQLAVTDTLIPSRLGMVTLPPNFISQSVSNSGSYSGLFYEDDAVRLTSAGSFSLSITARGSYSGRLQIGAKRYSLSGKLNSQRTGATKVITRRDGPDLTLDFQFVTDGQDDQVTGHLTDGTWSATLCGDRAVFGRGAAAPFAGAYTLVIPGYDANPSLPAGDGFGTVKVTSAGQVSLVGTLADGTKVSQSAPASRNGYWPLYLSLSSGKGTLMSWMAFASNTNSDLAGRLVWLKLAGSSSKYYLGGFSCECDAFGSIYLRTDPILNLPTANLSFYGGGLASGITNAITIGPRNKIGTPGKHLKLSFATSTGTFSGTYVDPTSGKTLRFNGAVFQKLNAAYGTLFGTGDQTSEVSLTPP